MNGNVGRVRVFVLLLGLCVAAGTATATNITIYDGCNNAAWVGGGTAANPNIGGEDNETEYGTVSTQPWDLESMDLTNGMLTLTGGFDFANGVASGQDTGDGVFRSGDIFISTIGVPHYGDASDIDGDGALASAYLYDYVIDIDWGTLGSGNTLTPTWRVHAVDNVTTVETTGVFFNQLNEADPYRLLSVGGNTTPLYEGQGVVSQSEGVFAAEFDVSWLIDKTAGGSDDVYFHFTEECGNDAMMGRVAISGTNTFIPVPEPASIGLLGLGILGLMGTRMRRKQF